MLLCIFPAGGTPLTAYRLEMSCLGSSDSGGGGSGSKGKGKLDALFELAYLGPEHSTGGWQSWWAGGQGEWDGAQQWRTAGGVHRLAGVA